MKTYIEHEGGALELDGKFIPKDAANRDYTEFLELQKRGEAEAVPFAKPEKTLEDKRREAYEAGGATADALIVALWEKIIEERSENADALQAIRAQVKSNFSKVR